VARHRHPRPLKAPGAIPAGLTRACAVTSSVPPSAFYAVMVVGSARGTQAQLGLFTMVRQRGTSSDGSTGTRFAWRAKGSLVYYRWICLCCSRPRTTNRLELVYEAHKGGSRNPARAHGVRPGVLEDVEVNAGLHQAIDQEFPHCHRRGQHTGP
jgi:hypothetical protein